MKVVTKSLFIRILIIQVICSKKIKKPKEEKIMEKKIRLPDWLTWTLLIISCLTAMILGCTTSLL